MEVALEKIRFTIGVLGVVARASKSVHTIIAGLGLSGNVQWLDLISLVGPCKDSTSISKNK